ncbi:hypothetical protein ACIRQP_40075 [Streptomyces sp. NPDC102274]|uniref:hypothetical protein n=1 Tax=Streptomyces sp. NPDC102274 TaxID=3366151 RepID=UPI00380B4DB6
MSTQRWWLARNIKIGATVGIAAVAVYFGVCHLVGSQPSLILACLIALVFSSVSTWWTRERPAGPNAHGGGAGDTARFR